MQRISTSLTVLNLALLAFTLWQRTTPVSADSTPAILRGRGLEIVDSTGKLRASISVIPEGPARRSDGSLSDQSGRIYPETVVLRLIRPDGRPSVKIATSQQGSGIDLSGGIDPTYMILNADGGNTRLTLIDKDGKRRLLASDSKDDGSSKTQSTP
jgi:hypothetical protein